ncbi:MAG TPA: hypothetical protein VE251_08685 [Xanthobacteraceae bacterium]|nr:hypothetical protein [Xanthobacteraceae bacterium]
MAEFLAQTLEPCGERSLIGQSMFAITFFACVVGHAFDTRAEFGKINSAPQAARTILIGFMRVKNCAFG